uniref:Protein HEXIM1 n=1 Tax=Lygus hesperus TaxID=30085 RepID=A0A0A9YZR7_LYGHE
MAEILENMVRVTGLRDAKCPTGSDDDSAVSGGPRKLPDVVGGDIENIEQAERKKKTRRRKAKRKNPYQKAVERGKKNMRMRDSKMYNHPVAPYNSNQFLIEDHNDLQDFDVKLMAAANKIQENPIVGQARTGRVRDASFTSAESDEDFFYSSPEDEEEFLSKEFSNTYRDLHVESLMSMAKPELIQTILQLEEKVDSLQKRLESEGEPEEAPSGLKKSPSAPPEPSKSPDLTAQFQTEISKLVLANQRLVSENARLRENSASGSPPRGTAGGGTSSSEDSESDSSSSSGSSGDEEMASADDTTTTKMNGDVKPPPGQHPSDNT